MTYYWLIEVVYPDDENRTRKWFSGRCSPGWDGETTMDPQKAQRYTYWEEAESDRLRLMPRILGTWHVVGYGFANG